MLREMSQTIHKTKFTGQRFDNKTIKAKSELERKNAVLYKKYEMVWIKWKNGGDLEI